MGSLVRKLVMGMRRAKRWVGRCICIMHVYLHNARVVCFEDATVKLVRRLKPGGKVPMIVERVACRAVRYL